MDEVRPGWWHEIDLDIFDLSDPSRCVLGQAYPGGYGIAINDASIGSKDPIARSSIEYAAILYGFEATTGVGYQAEIDTLDHIWRELIARRQAA